MRGLKFAIAVMTLLIIAGLTVIVVTIGHRATGLLTHHTVAEADCGHKTNCLPPPPPHNIIPLPDGGTVESVTAAGGNVVVHVHQAKADQLFFLSPKDGHPISQVTFSPTGPAPDLGTPKSTPAHK